MYRRYVRPTVVNDIERLQRDMNRLFGDISSRPRPASSYPAMNIWVRDDAAVVSAELPGVSPKEIEISIVGESLTLSGERKPDEPAVGTKYHRRERGCGEFSRTIDLPYRVDADDIEANIRNGVLAIHLPRAAADKPRKISVKSA
jgi:HSP20 family protein